MKKKYILEKIKCSKCGKPVHVWDCEMEKQIDKFDKLRFGRKKGKKNA